MDIITKEQEEELKKIKELRYEKQKMENEIEDHKQRINYLIFSGVHKETVNQSKKRKIDSEERLEEIDQQIAKKIKKITW